MSVLLVPLGRDASQRVAHIRTAAEGQPACGTIDEILAAHPNRVDLHAIEEDGQVVGVAAVERYRRGAAPDVREGRLRLRAFVIDADSRGRGLGTQALRRLAPYLAAHYPGADAADLSTDLADDAALRLLRAAGFDEVATSDDRCRLRLPLPRHRMREFHGWRGRLARALVSIRRRVPPGLRLLLGIVLIAGGILGFLPILGFWMISLGLAVAALDVRPMWRRLRGPRRRDDGK